MAIPLKVKDSKRVRIKRTHNKSLKQVCLECQGLVQNCLSTCSKELVVVTSTAFRPPARTKNRAWAELRRIYAAQQARSRDPRMVAGNVLFGFGTHGPTRIKGLPRKINEQATRQDALKR